MMWADNSGSLTLTLSQRERGRKMPVALPKGQGLLSSFVHSFEDGLHRTRKDHNRCQPPFDQCTHVPSGPDP